MRGFCGIDIQEERTFFAFAYLKGKEFIPFYEFDFTSFKKAALRDRIEEVEKEIKKQEMRHSFFAEKVYVGLPQEWERKKVFSDEVSLNKRRINKKVTFKDINLAKREIENLALGWEEKVIHHFVLEYELGGKKYSSPPLGKEGRKLKLKSFLVFMNISLYEEVKNIFEDLGRRFMGFVYHPLCYVGLMKKENLSGGVALINIRKKETDCFVFLNQRLDFVGIIDFGEEKMIKGISEKLSLPPSLVSKTIYQFASFGEVDFSKEINIKNKNHYLVLSLHKLNSAMRELCKEGIEKAIKMVKTRLGEKSLGIVFTGRFTNIENFSSFLKEAFPTLPISKFQFKNSSAFGCIRYSLFKFLEENRIRKDNLFRKLIDIYKEYF